VDVSVLRRLIDQLGRRYAPSTVTSILNITSGLLRFAVKNRYAPRNVVRDLDRDDRPGSKRRTEPRYLDADEVERLLAAMGGCYRPVAATCAYAGLRISEALGLRWADVDLDAGTLRVQRQLDDDLTLRQETKTPASAATVPMLPVLVRELRSWRTRQAASELRHGRSRSDLVFTTMRGQPQSRRNSLRAVHNAGDAAGLNFPGAERVGLHDLRHSFVAVALANGLTPVEAAELARHANPGVTLTMYAGLTETDRAGITQKLLDSGFGG
jgi:integrase